MNELSLFTGTGFGLLTSIILGWEPVAYVEIDKLCAPLPKGFKRRKLWFLMPGGYHTVRVLSWLERKEKNVNT